MLKIVVIAILCAFIIVYLKTVNSEYFTLALICSGIILTYYALEYVNQTFELFNEIINMTGITSDYIKIILKIVGIGYIVEFGAGTLEDMGLKSLSDKLIFIGKLVILGVSAPIIYAVFNLLKGLLQ